MDREQRLIAVLRAYVDAVNQSDADHESFSDSCADVVETLWMGPTADARRLLREVDEDGCSICNAIAGEEPHKDDCPYHGTCPFCGETEATEVIGDEGGDFDMECQSCGAEWRHYVRQELARIAAAQAAKL